MKSHGIQIIHAHLPWAGVVARLAGKLTGVPVIYTEHNKLERYHPLTRTMNLMTMNWTQTIIAVSNDVATSIKKHKPGLRSHLTTILNGVNTEHFKPNAFEKNDVRRTLNIPLQSTVIGTIAVFRTQKRLDLWVELARKILQRVPDAYFIVVGDGPLKSALHEKQRAEGLENRLFFPGLQTEVRPFIAAFDIYMMSSIFEGLPVALLEVMASGCSVVSTDAGGVKEVINHGIDGMLCTVHKPEDLVDLVTDLAKSEDKRKMLGEQARKKIEQTFSMDKMVRKLENLYHQMV